MLCKAIGSKTYMKKIWVLTSNIKSLYSKYMWYTYRYTWYTYTPMLELVNDSIPLRVLQLNQLLRLTHSVTSSSITSR